MVLVEIKEGLPEALTSQLRKDEKVYYFSYITLQGGCGSSGARQDHWIALTNRRVIYNTKIKKDQNYIEEDGILPLEKISFMSVTVTTEASGCSQAQSHQLQVGTSGGQVSIPVPTKEKAQEIRAVYMEIEEQHSEKKK